MLLNLYVEQVFSEALHDIQISFKINRLAVNNICDADDILLIAGNMRNLQIILDAVNTRGWTRGRPEDKCRQNQAAHCQ